MRLIFIENKRNPTIEGTQNPNQNTKRTKCIPEENTNVGIQNPEIPQMTQKHTL